MLPFLGLFLFGFNTKEVVKFSETPNPQFLKNEQKPEFVSPLKQKDIERVTFGFGETNTTAGVKFHNGIDLVGSAGKNVMASADGIVKTSTQSEENGNYIVIDHSDGYSTKYMHLKDRTVSEGDKVNSGKTIGHVGNTGKSTGPHLHFEILKSDKPLNPASFIPFKEAKVDVVKQKNSSSKKPAYSKTVKTIELKIDKNTTDESLEKMKSDLAKDGADFSYTAVRNSSKEIIDISLQITGKGTNGKKFNGNYNTSSDTPINPITILYDDENNAVSFWNSNSKTTESENKSKPTYILEGKVISQEQANELQGNNNIAEIKVFHEKKAKETYGINTTGDVLVLTVKDSKKDKRLIYLDGKEISEKEMDDLSTNEIASVNVLKGTSAKPYGEEGKNGVIEITTKNKEKVIVVGKSNHYETEEDKNVFVIRADEAGDYDNNIKIRSKGPNPLYIVDGKEVKKFKNANPDKIESIYILKGKAARKKYGRKGKNGVVEIITKEKN